MSDLPENVKGSASEQDFQLAEDDSMPRDMEKSSEPSFEQRLDYALEPASKFES